MTKLFVNYLRYLVNIKKCQRRLPQIKEMIKPNLDSRYVISVLLHKNIRQGEEILEKRQKRPEKPWKNGIFNTFRLGKTA